jgi:hypothetical protein
MKLTPKHFVLMGVSLFTSLWWWIGDLIDKDGYYNLFIFLPERTQKLHWYFHSSSIYVSQICLLLLLLSITKNRLNRNHRFLFKILLGFRTFQLIEYWTFGWETPIFVLSTAIMLSMFIFYARGL